MFFFSYQINLYKRINQCLYSKNHNSYISFFSCPMSTMTILGCFRLEKYNLLFFSRIVVTKEIDPVFPKIYSVILRFSKFILIPPAMFYVKSSSIESGIYKNCFLTHGFWFRYSMLGSRTAGIPT